MNFICRLNRRNFIYQVRILKFGDLLGKWKFATNAKFHHNVSKIMPARPKKNMGCEYQYMKGAVTTNSLI